MVYSLDILQTNSNSFEVNALATTTPSWTDSRSVIVEYSGVGIHTITGPTPSIDISTSVERNSIGLPEVYNTKITLTGKIVRTANAGTLTTYGSGIGPVVSGITGLQTLFSKNDNNKLEVFCKSSSYTVPMLSLTGVRLVSLDFPRSDDHWIFTSDYTAVFEYIESAITGFSVKSVVDSWNIEPLEDYVYTSTTRKITQKGEYHNPQLKPTAPSISSLQPLSAQTSSQDGATRTAQVDINLINIPQFKISHTVSAVGVPSGTGNIYNSAYLNAKDWVEYRLSQAFTKNDKTPNSGLINLGGTDTSFKGLLNGAGFLYNHLRTTNFSISDGKYEVMDTWLGLPTGIGYTEDYTIDMTTDDKYIHTVRVQGSIRGLSMTPNTYLSGGSPQYLTLGVTGVEINLSSSTGQLSGSLTHKILDMGADSAVNQFYANKYDNANSGWLFDIKPYLYRRACISMNSTDRDKDYVNPTTYINNTNLPPNNPTYSKHGVLNIIPISTSETHDPRRGTISYSYEYNNKFTIISGVLYENISMGDTGPTDVISEAFVLGRSLGPVLQNLGTRTSTKKEITIEIGVVPPSSLQGFFMTNKECPLYTGGMVYMAITGMIEGFKPFGDRESSIFGNTLRRSNVQGQVYVASDSQNWDPSNGRYSKSVSWIYQQCTNAKSYLDQ